MDQTEGDRVGVRELFENRFEFIESVERFIIQMNGDFSFIFDQFFKCREIGGAIDFKENALATEAKD